MPRHLSVGSAIDKNKVSSSTAWLALLEVHITDPNTRLVVETLRIVRNDENVTFGVDAQGNPRLFTAGNFELNITQTKNEAPSVSLTAQDQTRYIEQRMEEMAGGIFSEGVLTIVNAARLDKPAELEERFEITSSSVKDYVVTFQLGSENLLNIQFPKYRQSKDRCSWRFRGYGCAYAGPIATCDYTKSGPNGCDKHFSSPLPFRGLPGLVRMNM